MYYPVRSPCIAQFKAFAFPLMKPATTPPETVHTSGFNSRSFTDVASNQRSPSSPHYNVMVPCAFEGSSLVSVAHAKYIIHQCAVAYLGKLLEHFQNTPSAVYPWEQNLAIFTKFACTFCFRWQPQLAMPMDLPQRRGTVAGSRYANQN